MPKEAINDERLGVETDHVRPRSQTYKLTTDLINIADGIDHEGSVQGKQRNEGCYSVDRNHEHDTNDHPNGGKFRITHDICGAKEQLTSEAWVSCSS